MTTDPEATQALYSMYPLKIRHWLDQRGGLTPHMIFLSGRELAAMYQPCGLDFAGLFALGTSATETIAQLPRREFERSRIIL